MTWYQALAHFLVYIASSKAIKTHAYYQSQLRPLVRYATEHGIALEDFTARDMRKFLLARREAGVSDRTRYHDVVVAKRFFGFCLEDEIFPAGKQNPLARYVGEKPPRAHVPKPTIEQLQTLLNGIKSKWDIKINQDARFQTPKRRRFFQLRDYAIITGLVETAARSGEILGLHMDDYQPASKQIVIRKAKGKQPRTIPVSDAWIDAVEAWLKVRPDTADCPNLFPSEYGQPLQVVNFSRTFTRYRDYCNLSRFTAHGLRHYSLTELAKVDLWAAVQIAGHKDAKTTSIYLHSDPEHVRQAHADAAPLQKILVEKREAAKKRKRII